MMLCLWSGWRWGARVGGGGVNGGVSLVIRFGARASEEAVSE